MRARLSSLLAAFLLIALPFQGMAAVRISSCAHEPSLVAAAGAHQHYTHGAESGTAVAPAPDDAAAHACGETAGAGVACDNCAQCHACCAIALPAAARDVTESPRPHLVFASPAAFTGFIPEHLDPPPLG